MRFDSHHIVILDSLTKPQAKELLGFLLEERVRHIECIKRARLGSLIKPLIAPIYESAIVRHQEDIVSIDRKVLEVKRFLLVEVSNGRNYQVKVRAQTKGEEERRLS